MSKNISSKGNFPQAPLVHLLPEDSQFSPLPATFVTFATKGKDIGSIGSKGSKVAGYRASDFPEFLHEEEGQERLQRYYFDYQDGLTDREAAKLIFDDEEKWQIVKSTRNRADGVVRVSDGRPAKWGLTAAARERIGGLLKEHAKAQEALRERKAAQEWRRMETETQIETWKEFLQEDLHAELLEALRAGRSWLDIPFGLIASRSPELADKLLDNASDTLKLGKIALNSLDVQGDVHGFDLRIHSLPSAQKLSIKDLRAKHSNGFFQSTVTVVTRSEVRPTITSVRFECPSCGNIIPVLQEEEGYHEPRGCACGRKGKFKELSRAVVDVALMQFQQPLAEMIHAHAPPAKIRAVMRDDLCRKDLIDHIVPGAELEITYIPTEIMTYTKRGGRSTRLDVVLELVHAKPLKEHSLNLSFSDDEVADFRQEAGRKDFLERFCLSAFPNHSGDEEKIRAICCQLVAGGFNERRPDENLHIMLIGDPGTAKSELLIQASKIAPRARYTIAQNTSKAGLLGAVQKDEYSGRFYVEAGTLPLHNHGLVCVDEVDKVEEKEQTLLNQSLSQGFVTIDKAQVTADLPTDVRFLGAANPRTGRLSDGVTVRADFDIHSTLIDRCLIFVVRDTPGRSRDHAIANKILGFDDDVKPPYSEEWVRRFILYARLNVFPEIRDEEMALLREQYVSLRETAGRDASIPITPRRLAHLKQMTILFAKLRLRSETCKDDCAAAWEIFESVLRSFGWDATNLDRVIPRVRLPNKNAVLAAIAELAGADGLCAEESLSSRFPEGLDTVLHLLKRDGAAYSPKPGFWGVI